MSFSKVLWKVDIRERNIFPHSSAIIKSTHVLNLSPKTLLNLKCSKKA